MVGIWNGYLLGKGLDLGQSIFVQNYKTLLSTLSTPPPFRVRAKTYL